MKAEILPCGQVVRMSGAMWVGDFPVAELPQKLRFYRGLRDRGSKKPGEPGPWAKHYLPSISALEALQRDLRASAPCVT